jgi:hypothetical protein
MRSQASFARSPSRSANCSRSSATASASTK